MRKVLWVDDEKDMVNYLKTSLEKHNLEVISASTGCEALDYCRDNFNLVILDLGLPDMDGFDVLKEIKNKIPDVKVIVLSGHDNVLIKDKLIKLGASYIFSKPINPIKFSMEIGKILTETGGEDGKDT